MSVVTTHRLDVTIPKVEGVSVFAALSFGGTPTTVNAYSNKSADECRAALAHWLAAVTKAVTKALEE